NPGDSAAAEAALPELDIRLAYAPEGQKVFCNGEDVTGRIRTPEVSMGASAVAAVPAVRAFLLGLQRGLAKEHNVLMDGRDIGTVVLPDAPLKIFLTASPEERARRRVRQMEEGGQAADFAAILQDIRQRDFQDSTRETAPLKPAADSVLLDTSGISFQESVEKLVSLVRARMGQEQENG
ncbi:MAG: (d)CMP kinase, partial [Acutalibacter sp.]|nr:(d)CMP kinase [Acutalibacter sp.]